MSKRRKLNNDTPEPARVLPKRSHVCPVCSTSIPISDLPAHYEHERKLFQSAPRQPPTTKRPAAVLALSKIIDHPRNAKRTEESIVLSRVRANRESRRKNQGLENTLVEDCPICGLELSGTGVSVNEHVSICLDNQREEEEGGNWDVYTFGGQT